MAASTSPALLSTVLANAAAGAGRLLERCLDEAVTGLQEAENKSQKSAERRMIAEAWRELLRHRAAWPPRFGPLLSAAFAGEGSGATVATSSRKVPPKSDSLGLVDDAHVLQSIESSRLTQLLLSAVEQPLAELDGLLSTLQGLPAVSPEQNPVRPDVIAQVLRQLMTEPGIDAERSSLWVRHLAGPLGRELAGLYREMVRQLQAANVQAAAYRLLPAVPSRTEASGSRPAEAAPAHTQRGGSSGSGPGPAGAPAREPATGFSAAALGNGSAWADLSALQLGDELVQEFLWGGAQPQHHRPLGARYYERVGHEVAALEALAPASDPLYDPAVSEQGRDLPVVDRPQRHVGVDSPLPAQRWGAFAAPRERSLARIRLKQQAADVGQVLGLEVVRKLVDQVAQDPRLLAPVREAVVALEPSLLQLAMVDPRFFGKEDHPARRLVERVAERSFKYNDEFGEDFQSFVAPVAAAFNRLNAQPLQDVEPVQQALDELEAVWREQDGEEASRREGVLDAVRYAEQRQAEADQIAWELSQRADLENVPPLVQDFLFGPWSLVMAHARLADGRRQIDPGGYGALVTDLLWSVKQDVTLRQPVKLIEMIPGLLAKLREGLAALGQDEREAEGFLTSLEKLHRPVLRLRAKQRKGSQGSSGLAGDLEAGLEPGPRQQPKPAASAWMGRDELDVAGFKDTLPSDYAALDEIPGDAAPGEAAAEAPVDVDAVIAGLQEGCWVDLYSRRHWLRAKLIWASTRSTLFMFTSHGGQPHSMTRRSLERLLRERLLRPVDMQGVVAHAIDQLSETADGRSSRAQSRPMVLEA